VDLPETSPALIVVVDDDPTIASLVVRWLKSAGHRTMVANSGKAAQKVLLSTDPDLVVVDLDLGDMTGLDLMRWRRESHEACPFVTMTGSADVGDVVQSMRDGALEYMVKPVTRSQVLQVVTAALQQASARRQSHSGVTAASIARHGLVGASPALQRVHQHINRLSQCDVTVLITGETGTGKEVVARAIHSASQRADAPFVAVNCGAIVEGLQESEFFGHERGAFTGAISQRIGAFEQANGGVIFLDEVGELSLSLQVMLLRVIQERRFRRVGGAREVQADVRILAATHRDLLQLVDQGLFREDLFYRIAVYELVLPPLRDRGDDVLLIANHFLAGIANRSGRPDLRLSPQTESVLMAYRWPGNVRELHNAMEHAAVAGQGLITPDDLPGRIRAEPRARPAVRLGASTPGQSTASEREAIMAAIAAADGNVSEAMRTLGIPRTTMYRKMRKLGIRSGSD